MASSGHQGGDFLQVRSRRIPPNSVCDVCCDFRNRIVLSFSGRYQRHINYHSFNSVCVCVRMSVQF